MTVHNIAPGDVYLGQVCTAEETSMALGRSPREKRFVERSVARSKLWQERQAAADAARRRLVARHALIMDWWEANRRQVLLRRWRKVRSETARADFARLRPLREWLRDASRRRCIEHEYQEQCGRAFGLDGRRWNRGAPPCP